MRSAPKPDPSIAAAQQKELDAQRQEQSALKAEQSATMQAQRKRRMGRASLFSGSELGVSGGDKSATLGG